MHVTRHLPAKLETDNHSTVTDSNFGVRRCIPSESWTRCIYEQCRTIDVFFLRICLRLHGRSSRDCPCADNDGRDEEARKMENCCYGYKGEVCLKNGRFMGEVCLLPDKSRVNKKKKKPQRAYMSKRGPSKKQYRLREAAAEAIKKREMPRLQSSVLQPLGNG